MVPVFTFFFFLFPACSLTPLLALAPILTRLYCHISLATFFKRKKKRGPLFGSLLIFPHVNVLSFFVDSYAHRSLKDMSKASSSPHSHTHTYIIRYNMTASASDLHAAMVEWVFSESGIAARMEEFAHNYCAYFEFIAERSDFESAENKLVYTQIHHKFQELFEGELAAFLSSQGWTCEQFLEQCSKEMQKGSEESSESTWGSIYEIVISLTDYEIFKVMMLDTRRKFPDLVAPSA